MAMISRAGGRATQEGMTFEAAVGTWFAAYISCQMPIGARFGLTSNAIPIEVQFETGHNLDDIEIRLSNGGRIFVQCKTRPSAQTTHHLVELYEYIIAAAPEAVFDRISALLVGPGASKN